MRGWRNSQGVSRETHNFDVCTARKMFTYNGGAQLETDIKWGFDKRKMPCYIQAKSKLSFSLVLIFRISEKFGSQSQNVVTLLSE